MNSFKKTYRLDRLYHRFMKPFGIPYELVHEFANELHADGFIELHSNDRDFLTPRYSETEKLSDGKNKTEFFALMRVFKNERC